MSAPVSSTWPSPRAPRVLRRGRSLLIMAVLGADVGCAGDLVGPAAALRVVTASAPELVVGGEMRLDASVGGTLLLPGQVEWLSRDPSTVTVRDGIVRGVSPGTAYVVAIRRTAVDSIRLTVVFSDLATGQAGIRSGNDLLRLTGAAWVTQSTSSLAYYTTILASSGGVIDTPAGGCCIIRGDTILQINYLGGLTLGDRILQPPKVRIETRLTDVIMHTGDDDVLLMIREDGYRMRFYFPVRPTVLEVLALEEPSATKVGRVRGRLSFEAAGILQTFDTRGNATYTPIGDRTTKVYAEFDTPLSFKLFTPPIISPP